MISKLFDPSSDVFEVPIDSNAFDVEDLGDWINDSKFNHLKKAIVGALVMVLKEE